MRMRALTLLILVCAGACGGGGEAEIPAADTLSGPVAFRVLREGQTATYCVEAPDFAVSRDEDEWIDVFVAETQCLPEDDVSLPSVDFDTEVAVAAWWKTESCLGHQIKTVSVERRPGRSVVVTAETSKPQGACARALGQLQSFLALERSELVTGGEAFEFVLDGARAGRLPGSDS